MSYSIKIVDLDFYMGRPLQGLDVMYSEFRGTSITQVPILMLFGSTSTGEKICVHIHGVFPYLYIPYDGSENVNDLIYQIANNLDKAINISLNQAASNVQHIYKISLVSGIPMYGYHAKSHQFLKICLYNPLLIKKVSNLLKNSSALGRIYQPHETHLNFTLQFMIDYNLHGMSNMIASKIKFRSDPNRPNTTKNINPELFLSSSVLKISKCELEGDILAENIVNRQEISSGNINVNPGIATIWSDEMQRRRNKGETSQIDHPLELSRSAEPTKSHILFKQALSDRLAVLSDQTNVDNSNISVYPAETPRSTEIQNSSLIDCQTPTSNIESTMDKSENIESNDNSLKTISVSMDEDAFKLLDILNILEIREDRIEEDSILLQVIKNDDDDDNELDMSIPWQSCATSTKTVSVKLDTEDSDEDLNKTLIPQLDGGNDDVKVFSRISPRLQRETKYSETLIKKAFFVKIVKLDLDKDESSTSNFRTCNYTTILNNETTTQVGVKCPEKMPKTNIQTSRSNEERRKRKPLTLKQLEYRVKKLNYKNQVFTVMKKMHERERSILLLLNKTNKLAFNVTSSIELKAPYKLKALKDENAYSSVKILNDILIKTSRYVEPTLHFIVRYPNPNRSRYLFYYRSDSFEPEIEKFSKKNYNRYKQHIGLKPFITNHMESFDNNNNNNNVKCKSSNSDHEAICIEKLKVLRHYDHNRNSIEINNNSVKSEFNENLSISENHKFNSSAEKLDHLQQQLQQHKEILKIPSYSNSFQDKKKFYNENTKCTSKSPPTFPSTESSKIFENPSFHTQYDFSCTDQSSSSSCCPSNEEKNFNGLLHNEFRRSSRLKSSKCISKYKYRFFYSQNSSSHLSNNVAQRTEISKRTTEKMLRTHLPRIELEKENKKLCVSLDGTVDSSSSDEDESNEICKVSAQSTKNSTTPLSKIVSVKRQLDFYEEPLQSTFIEEKLTCSFSQAKVKIGLRKIKPVPTSEIKELSTKENDGHNFSSYHNNSKDKNKSFFNSQDFSPRTVDNLTVADKYDKDEEYTAKEGSSKLSMPDDKSARDTDAASNDIIDSIKFYQQIKEKESCSPPSDVSNQFKVIIKPCKSAISKIEAIKSLNTYNIPQVKYEEPFYSNVDDVTGRVEIGYNVLKIRNKSSVDLHDFDSQTDGLNVTRKSILESIPSEVPWKRSNINNIILASCKEKKCIVLPIRRPPTVVQVQDWLIKKCKKSVNETNITVKKNTIFVPCSHGSDDKDTSFSLSLTPSTPNTSHSIEKASETASNETLTSPVFDNKCKKRKLEVKQKKLTKSLLKLSSHSSRSTSQITGVTINNSYGFKNLTADFRDARAVKEYQYLTIMVMELHIVTRGDLKPDPAYDSIVAIFYAIFNDVPENCSNKPNKVKGVIVLNCVPLSTGDNQSSASEGLGQDCDMEYADTEENMLKQFIKLIDYWDPDIMAGYEIELLSWGYLIDRAYAIGMNLKPLLSRTSLNDKRRRKNDDDVSSKELKIEGRIMLNVWRLMRYEIALQSYTIESVVYHILHKRVPSYSFKDLTFWWNCRYNLYRRRVMDYYLLRIVAILELFDKLDFIGLTSELARLFGILFYEVLSRGSQFRVESMMLRLAKPLNFIPVSPSVEQRAQMKAPEYIPLILEPESKLYNDPVIVLDFQSLYPSIIIAYNYCFTTCIGRVELLGKNGPFEFGACQLKVPRRSLKNLLKKDRLNFSPCGVGFVKKKVRDGILPRMLREILDTRLMVKNVMKKNKDDPILEKVLHNRQLGLKLIANVTYGYTAANFSGRMPAVEVGDSVVSKGRETLQRAIELVDSTSEWGARVVYGDTDSLFVLVPGKTREQAFDIGKKIVDSVSLANPDPIKLKLEKIYHPCILQTKKRYVGYMYENVDQKEPVYDAKGIETVRRDGCPAVTKMLEKCLRMLFESKDVSLIKKYILRQFDKIVAGRVSIQDLTFAKEYRGASGYRPGACVPALELTRKWILSDKRNEPRNGERVPYIIVNGPPGLPLIRLVRSPRDLLNDPSLRPNTIYYITRVIIPPINRCFNLIGIDLLTWYSQMPRKHIKNLPGTVSPGKKSTISQYFSTSNCILCSEQTQTGICDRCTNQPQSTVTSLIEKLKSWEQNYENCVLICKSCTSFVDEIKCISLDCPVLYRRIQFSRDVQQIPYVRQLLTDQSLF